MNFLKSVVIAALVMTGLTLFAQAEDSSAIKIACVGDSITFGACASKGKDYPSVLQNLLGDKYKVTNFGVCARTGLKRGMENNGSFRGYQLTPHYKQSLEFQPDIVLLMFGTNDSKHINWREFSNQFGKDMESWVLEYRNLKSKPVVVLLFPPHVKKESFQISDKVVEKEIIPILKDVAKKLKCPTVDLFTLTKKNVETAYAPDGVHPNDTGYSLIAQELQKAMKDLKLNKK